MLNLIRAVWVDFEIPASVCKAHLLRLNNPNCFYPSPKCRSNLRVQKYYFFQYYIKCVMKIAYHCTTIPPAARMTESPITANFMREGRRDVLTKICMHLKPLAIEEGLLCQVKQVSATV